MGRIVGQVQEERLFVRCPILQVVQGPVGKQIGGMSFGINYFLVQSHPVHSSPQVGPVIVHHIPQKTFEVIEPTVVGGIGSFETQVPFPDDGCVVAFMVQGFRMTPGTPTMSGYLPVSREALLGEQTVQLA